MTPSDLQSRIALDGIAIFMQADATRIPLADDSVSAVITSPPYLDARTYGINAQRGCVAWIDWMLGVVRECLRVSVGPVIINCAGVTRDRCYRPGPEGLLYEAWRAGIECYRPAYWFRVGIPGSGSKNWLRADVEYCLCFKRPGKLPTFNIAGIGHKPKWGPGGEMSNRQSTGARVNQWGMDGGTRKNARGISQPMVAPSHVNQWGHSADSVSCAARGADGTRNDKNPPSHFQRISRGENGSETVQGYNLPVFADPGNLLKIKVGGGQMGHPMAHENEAPFPEGVPEFFIKGWTNPGDVVLDPFSGSGTTACVAARLGRIGIGCDLRFSQCELGARRYATPYAKKTKAAKVVKELPSLFAEVA
jgi:hypothetical protein